MFMRRARVLGGDLVLERKFSSVVFLCFLPMLLRHTQEARLAFRNPGLAAFKALAAKLLVAATKGGV